jgi:hypothetical protein
MYEDEQSSRAEPSRTPSRVLAAVWRWLRSLRPPGNRTLTAWGVILSAVAVIVATVQAAVSFAALGQFRESLVYERRIAACTEAQTRGLEVRSAYSALVQAVQRGAGDAEIEAAAMEVQERFVDYTGASQTLNFLGSPELIDAAGADFRAYVALRNTAFEPRTVAEMLEAVEALNRSTDSGGNLLRACLNELR